jgi:DNA-binding GntR family transcriptional regulator
VIKQLPKQGMTLALQVAEVLKEAITNGDLAPGERLYQEEITKKLGVSRIPVRLALEMLQGTGLVTLSPHKGAAVTELSIMELKDIFEVRMFVEGMAIEKSLPTLTDKDIEQAEKTVAAMRRVSDIKEWLKLNREFHDTINAGFTSTILRDIMLTLRTNAQRYVLVALAKENRFSQYGDEHEQILSACLARDVSLAKQLVQEHLHNTVLVVEKYLQETDSATVQ